MSWDKVKKKREYALAIRILDFIGTVFSELLGVPFLNWSLEFRQYLISCFSHKDCIMFYCISIGYFFSLKTSAPLPLPTLPWKTKRFLCYLVKGPNLTFFYIQNVPSLHPSPTTNNQALRFEEASYPNFTYWWHWLQ